MRGPDPPDGCLESVKEPKDFHVKHKALYALYNRNKEQNQYGNTDFSWGIDGTRQKSHDNASNLILARLIFFYSVFSAVQGDIRFKHIKIMAGPAHLTWSQSQL